jgi:alpha-tubulin suppressor-like RCC1 family protein
LGSPATFAVSIIGNEPLAYQWQLQGTNLPSATNTQLLIPHVAIADAGEYRVVVSNPAGSATSHVAHLEILFSPSAAVWPDSALVLQGGAVEYDAKAYGLSPLRLQWQFNNADLPSATNSTLILSNILSNQAGAYTLVVTNDLGSVISPPASLTVMNPAQVLAWGQYWSGELNVPAGLSGVVTLAAGRDHVLALRRNGTVAAWGMNYMGQIDVPPGLSNVAAISAGQEYSLALKRDGTLVEWGGFGPDIVPPPGLTNVAAVAGGQDHAVALLRDGTVVTWGTIASTPAGLSAVSAVEAGNGFCLALRSNGVVVAWGDNSASQCNVPADLTNAVSLASGYFHSLALRHDGTVIGWGANDHGQTDVPQAATNVIAIAAGYMHSMALRKDGTLVV